MREDHLFRENGETANIRNEKIFQIYVGDGKYVRSLNQ